MHRRLFLLALTFLAVFFIHTCLYLWQLAQDGYIARYATYFSQQVFFISFAWGLAGAFLTFALMRFFEERHFGWASFLGSLVLTAFFWLVGTFLLGCYAQAPLRSFYLSVFGVSYSKLTKPLLAAVTTLSVALGGFWIERRCEAVCHECHID